MPIHGYPGGVITANPVAPTSTVATGVWTTEQQLQATSAGNWPRPGPPQPISRSLRFNNADSAYLTRTPGSAATSSQKFTVSFWVKRTNLSTDGGYVFGSGVTSGAADAIGFNSSDQLNFEINGTTSGQLVTTQLFRDVSAWYHIVYAVDTTQATASNRIKVYVNGVQVTAFGTASYPSQNYNFVRFNQNTYAQYIGFIRGGASSIYYLNGYLTETYDIDGQALTPSSFGQTNAATGVWEPIPYTGTYGTNGFYVNFSDNSNTTAATLGKDYSGNGNNWTPNNFSVTAGAGNDSLVDTPTSYGTDTGVGGEVRGNYCTLNAVSTGRTLANGNLDYAGSATGIVKGTIGVSSGKWYWEVTASNGSAPSNAAIGICNINLTPTTSFLGNTSDSWSYAGSAIKYNNGSGASYGATYAAGDIIGVAFDADAGTLTFYKNGVSQGQAYSGITGLSYCPAAGNNTTNDFNGYFNFGQRPFTYTAPSGFKALCTQNLPTPTIGATSTTQANDYMNVVLYTGNGANPRTVSGVGFQPDFVWTKSRSSAFDNWLFDAVRGATKTLTSNSTSAEITYANSLKSFISDGFTVGDLSDINANGGSYVAWNWKANGAGSSNTAGTITSTVSANTTSGFSVVTFTGAGPATIGHGLGVAPSMVIMKARNEGTAPWAVYHASIGAGNYLALNSTAASTAATTIWNNTAPTSTVFSIGSGWSTFNFLAYCFAPVAGYSAFGSYSGNGSSDGPFVYTGFRPEYVMIKVSSAGTNGWQIRDVARDPYNTTLGRLYANLSNAEGTTSGNEFDILSNGFKVRNSGGDLNSSSQTYIYMAFAEFPFKYSLAR